MIRLFLLAAFLVGFMLAPNTSSAQYSPDHPSDFLSSDWHKERRAALRTKLPPNSVAVFFANAVRNRSNDVDYIYHQDPDYLYLTGHREPHGVLLIFKDMQSDSAGKSYNELIFVQPRNPLYEMWTGRRLGQDGVKNRLGFEMSFTNKEFSAFDIDFSRFNKILFFDFFNDVRDVKNDTGDLYDLIEQFKAKVGYPVSGPLTGQPEEAPQLDTRTLVSIMNELRGIKTPEEIALLRKAVAISAIGQAEVMKAMKPGMSEREIQGIHEFVYKKYQAEDIGYPSIVGAGHNGCILHYIDNYKPAITNKELVLMDLGAEYHGYTADVTRTIPASGKFSKEQKLIYDIVLKAQDEVFAVLKPGVKFSELNRIARRVVSEGLAELGIIDSTNQRHMYLPHGISHHIGLAVHDRGTYDVLEENMVISIEPGIYIPAESKCDEKWWNIAVRIEDNVLITKDGYELLSILAPRTTADIEKTMKMSSPLDKFVLPKLE